MANESDLSSAMSAGLASKFLWKKWEPRFFYLCIALGLTLLLNFATHFIASWGYWYSNSANLRWQTDSFFRGRIVLDSTPNHLRWDLVWDRGIQQVWGLGVPAFRFVFEVLARVFGFGGFPDKVTFLIAYCICALCLIRTFLVDEQMSDAGNGTTDWLKISRNLCAVGLLLFAPPFVTLLRTRFDVYEEIVAYGYLYGLISFVSLLRMAQRPVVSRLVLLSLWAGLGAFIRPTLLFYGAVAWALAMVIAWRARTSRIAMLASALVFCLCGALLCYLNWSRFGAMSEFGHTLNLESLSNNTFSLKFGFPFQHEPLGPAARDELGSLFFGKQFNGFDFYKQGCIFGQSATYRWHEMYFTTFDAIYLCFFTLSCACWVFGWKRIRATLREFGNGPDPAGNSGGERLDSAFVVLAVPWAAGSFACLFAFYLWSPSMSSRYAVDFLPAVMIGIAALIWSALGFALKHRRTTTALVVCLGVLVWVIFETTTAAISPGHGPQGSLDAVSMRETTLLTEGVVNGREGRLHQLGRPNPTIAVKRIELSDFGQRRIVEESVSPATSASAMATPLRRYEMGKTDDMERHIPYNTAGWNVTNGAVEPSVILFASDPECVVLSLFSPGDGQITRDDIAPIQAKIGLEYLSRESTQIVSNRATVVFRGPQRNRYKSGLQVCFLGFISPTDLGIKVPTVALAGVSFMRTNVVSEKTGALESQEGR
jgi:hypothetical protein